MSNLSATGKANLVELSNELDYANAITVASANTNDFVSYSATKAGVLIAFSHAGGSSSATLHNSHALIWDETNGIEVGTSISSSIAGHLRGCAQYFLNKSQTVKYLVSASGGTNNDVKVSFIPFKNA